MKRIAVIFAEGFEEVEALTVVDLLRRAGFGCDMLSLADTDTVSGAHGIRVSMDGGFAQADFAACDGIVLPGGMPGTLHLADDARLLRLLQDFFASGRLTAAICAAPTVLAKAGILKGKKAVCYPGMEDELTGALPCSGPVAVDGTVITGRGVGTAIPFALALVSYFSGEEAAAELSRSIVF
ncbi:MAG: DJ-1/PfpI family protein [Oscillospiraceae bacterium]|nr:DJ-1/PfpI family protein [Oscillospiraceae bacterium]